MLGLEPVSEVCHLRDLLRRVFECVGDANVCRLVFHRGFFSGMRRIHQGRKPGGAFKLSVLVDSLVGVALGVGALYSLLLY